MIKFTRKHLANSKTLTKRDGTGCSSPLLQCLNGISQAVSVPKEHKNLASKPLPRFRYEKPGCSTIDPAHSWAQRAFAKADWHMDPGGVYRRQGSGARQAWRLCLLHGCSASHPRPRPCSGGIQRSTDQGYSVLAA